MLLYCFKLLCIYTAELTIGFINAPYQANEADNFTTVEFGIIEGTIAPSVSVPVELSFSDLSAAGKYFLKQ